MTRTVKVGRIDYFRFVQPKRLPLRRAQRTRSAGQGLPALKPRQRSHDLNPMDKVQRVAKTAGAERHLPQTISTKSAQTGCAAVPP